MTTSLTHTTDLNLLERYNRAGFHLLPLGSDSKIPVTSNGLHDATIDWDQIVAWYEEYPDCNWGLKCGKDSGIVVVDVDTKNEGDLTLVQILDGKPESDFDTFTVVTPSKGFHYYFKYDDDRPTTKKILARGIDFQSEGSYVVVPPSSIEDRPYSIAKKTAIQPLPDWIYEIIEEPKEAFEFSGDEIGEGNRHNTLLSLAGYVRRKGVGYEPLLALVQETNKKYCKPPLPDRQIISMVSRLSKYEPGDPILQDESEQSNEHAVKSEALLISHILSGDYTNKELCLADIFTLLEPNYFIEDRSNVIFQTAKNLWKQSVTPNFVNINIEFKRLNQDEIEKRSFQSMNYNDVKFHINNILHHYKNRALIHIYKKGLQRASKGLEPPSSIISDISTKTLPLLGDSKERTVHNVEQQIVLARSVYDNAVEGKFILNEPTGYATLDEGILGLPKSQIIIIAGRPGHHKTSFALNLNRKMNELWRELGEEGSSLIFSAEMNATQLAVRNMCAYGEFTQQEFRRGTPDKAIVARASELYRQNLRTFVDTTSNPTGDYMITKAQALNQVTPIRVVFFDFIELTGESDDMMTLRLQATAVKLKQLAKLLDIPVVILSQTNRDLYHKRGTPVIPRDGDLSWSDGLTKLADQIMFTVWHHKFATELDYSEVEEHIKSKNVLDLYLSKNRDGEQQRITFNLKPEYGMIIDPSKTTTYNRTETIFT